MTHSERSATPHLDSLKAWADQRGFRVLTTNATQREPGYSVALREQSDGWVSPLLSRESSDSVDTAAMYLLNVLDRLGALGE